MHLDLERLGDFVKLLKSYIKVRHAFEFRHASWWCDEVFALLKENGMAFCHAVYFAEVPLDIPNDMPFHYVRFHGIGAARYAGDYPERMLAEWAKRIRKWSHLKKDSYMFFNNDTEGHAIKNAMVV